MDPSLGGGYLKCEASQIGAFTLQQEASQASKITWNRAEQALFTKFCQSKAGSLNGPRANGASNQLLNLTFAMADPASVKRVNK
jgi:hypothetical protein